MKKITSLLLFLILSVNMQSYAQDSDAETLLKLKKVVADKMRCTSDSVYLMKDFQNNLMNTSVLNENYNNLRRMTSPEDEKFILPHFAPFYHGVASGDPLSDRVIIWTRVTPSDTNNNSPITVRYYVSVTMDFSQILQQGSVVTDTSRDYTVKVDVGGLQPDTYYYYFFESGGKKSIVGRTKTTAVGPYANAKIILLTGSDYRRGYFNGLANISEKDDIDLVFHSGDYIYEQGGGPPDRVHDPDAEIYRLQDYRTRISQYRLDTNLMRCHQLYPWVIIWDDHDIVVDAVSDTSFRHDANQFGLYKNRKHAAVKAFREWMPVRDDTTSFYKNFRKISLGNLVDMFIIDERLYDRDRFATGVTDSIYNSPTAKMLGPVQLSWLTHGLKTSTAQWKIVGGGLMFSQLQIASVPLIFENWDGYPAERNKVFDTLEQNHINNVVFLSGDFHCGFANDVARSPYNIFQYNPFNGNGSLAVEFLPPALASDNFDEGNDYGLGASNATLAEGVIKTANPHIKHVDLTHQGYVLLDITAQRAQGEFWYSQNILDPENTNESCGQIWADNNNANHLVQSTHVATPKPNVAVAPPFFPADSALSTDKEVVNPIILSYFPNPFASFCQMNYVVTSKTHMQMYLTNLEGHFIKNIMDEYQNLGNYNVFIDGRELARGPYLLVIETAAHQIVKKLVKN
ncbi:MAG: alkaline phosphatase D family protein [Bacteroidota bacterium]